MTLLRRVGYIVSILAMVAVFILNIINYEDFIKGNFLLTIATFGIPIAFVGLSIIHWRGEATGWEHKFYEKEFWIK